MVSFITLFIGTAMNASPVKISFLDSGDALKQTADFLTTKGCDSNSINLFRTVVHWNNESPLGFNLKKFPKSENGFYSFQSVSNLAKALTQPLIYANHPYQLNCFDFVILLTADSMKIEHQADDLTGPFLPPVNMTNKDDVAMGAAATPRDAYNESYPSWHIEASKAVFDESRQNKRMCLTAAFNAFQILPISTTRENLENTLLNTLQEGWKRQGIAFPTNMEIVLFHSVILNEHNSLTSHAGLLFQNHGQYIYLEKAGPSGPYVRLDFSNKKELLSWFKVAIKPVADKGNFLCATFNDRQIESLGMVGR